MLLGKIAEKKKKRGFVSKEKELDVYRKADSDSEDSELSSISSSSDGDVDDFVPGDDEGVLYSSEDDGWRVKKKRGSVKVKRVGKSILRERAEEGKVENKSYADVVCRGREPSSGSKGEVVKKGDSVNKGVVKGSKKGGVVRKVVVGRKKGKEVRKE